MASPLTSMRLTEGVAEHIRGMIHRGELGPGDRLPPERELAEELGVARASLREAIKSLAARGYVEVRRGANGGTFVTQLSRPFSEWREHVREQRGEMDEIIDFRMALEQHAAGLAAQRRDRGDLTQLRSAITMMESAESRAAFRLSDSRFHSAVARASKNTRLQAGIDQARGALFSPHDLLEYVEPVAESLTDHREIYEAIRGKDAGHASSLMTEHIERTREQLRVIVLQDSRRKRSTQRSRPQ
ncbi:MAG: FadR/GntR family transcriptional regulator [Streptosporangiales bacterium]